MTSAAVVVLHAVHGQVTMAEYLWRVVLHLAGVTTIALFAYGCIGIFTGDTVRGSGDRDLEEQESGM